MAIFNDVMRNFQVCVHDNFAHIHAQTQRHTTYTDIPYTHNTHTYMPSIGWQICHIYS